MTKRLPRSVHSYLSPKCEARKESLISRVGLFAKKTIKKDELILIWGGNVIMRKDMKNLPKCIQDNEYPCMVYPGFFFGPRHVTDLDQAEMINHSCDPNAGIKGQCVLVARRDIKAGEEITYDYETTDIEDMNFKCNCGSRICRGRIDGGSWKNPSWRKKNKNYLSWYISEKIRKLKQVKI
jgi:SET domain-containing protein